MAEMKHAHEKWGKFVETKQFGQVLIIINQEDGSDEHSVWIIARHSKLTRVEFNIPFDTEVETQSFFNALEEDEVEARLILEIERLQSLH